jgi:hypothetical protein
MFNFTDTASPHYGAHNARMSASNKATGFRAVINFISTLGVYDASVAVIGALLALAGIGGEGKNGDWTFVAVGFCTIVIYFNIAYLSRPRDDADKDGAQ